MKVRSRAGLGCALAAVGASRAIPSTAKSKARTVVVVRMETLPSQAPCCLSLKHIAAGLARPTSSEEDPRAVSRTRLGC
ncbi:hypothetical protein GCM10027448_28630 [Nocardioides dilutus]